MCAESGSVRHDIPKARPHKGIVNAIDHVRSRQTQLDALQLPKTGLESEAPSKQLQLRSRIILDLRFQLIEQLAGPVQLKLDAAAQFSESRGCHFAFGGRERLCLHVKLKGALLA